MQANTAKATDPSWSFAQPSKRQKFLLPNCRRRWTMAMECALGRGPGEGSWWVDGLRCTPRWTMEFGLQGRRTTWSGLGQTAVRRAPARPDGSPPCDSVLVILGQKAWPAEGMQRRYAGCLSTWFLCPNTGTLKLRQVERPDNQEMTDDNKGSQHRPA